MLFIGIVRLKVILHLFDHFCRIEIEKLDALLIGKCLYRGMFGERRVCGRRQRQDQPDLLLSAEVRDPLHVFLHGGDHLCGVCLFPVRIIRPVVLDIAIIAESRRVSHQAAPLRDLSCREVLLMELFPPVVISNIGDEALPFIGLRLDLAERPDRIDPVARPVHVVERFLACGFRRIGRVVKTLESEYALQHDHRRGLCPERLLQPEIIQDQVLIPHSEIVTCDPVFVVQHLRAETGIRVAAPQKEHVSRILVKVVEAAVCRYRGKPLPCVVFGHHNTNSAANAKYRCQHECRTFDKTPEPVFHL